MRKLIITLLTTLLLFGQQANASNIEVLPTMQSKTNVQDRVWVGTFQIVWNDFMDKVAHTIVKFPEGTPDIVNELNRQDFTVNELSENCYYRYVGKIQKSTKKTIAKAIRKKFHETSDLLDKLDLTPSKDRFIVYAILKKDFQFVSAFDKLGQADFRGKQTEFFGINNSSDEGLDKNVKVLFYNTPSDFAVVLDTVGKDEVYLYKTPNTKAFNYIYSDMVKKQQAFKGETDFRKTDELKVPNLKFFEEKSFEEVCGKRIKGTNLMIDQAMETIKFEMDNTGVKLKSEAAMTIMKMSLEPQFEPRYFNFDDTFVLFLKEKGKDKPYFALRVHDIENFQ